MVGSSRTVVAGGRGADGYKSYCTYSNFLLRTTCICKQDHSRDDNYLVSLGIITSDHRYKSTRSHSFPTEHVADYTIFVQYASAEQQKIGTAQECQEQQPF